MLQLALLILQIMFTTNPVSSGSSGSDVVSNDFAYVGTYLSSNSNSYDQKNYFISTSTVNWAAAQQSCRNLFGTNSSTVSVRTEEEWNFLQSILEPHESVTLYWTAGMYDSNYKVWRWPDNSTLTAWAPWDINQPAANPSSIHRVVIAHTNRSTAAWRTVSNTQSHRFICEVPYSPPIPISCSDMDLVIVLDSSASIGSHNYKKARNFAVKLVAQFTEYNSTRIAFLIYSDVAVVVIDLDNSMELSEIDTAIMNAPYLKGSTATHAGIEAAVMQFDSLPRSDRNVTKNVVVITEGESSNSTLTAAAVQTANSMGINTFSIGITPSANETDLLVIGGGYKGYVFTTDECDTLTLLVEPLIRTICSDDE